MQSVTLPAPIGGLNTVDAGASMPPTDCVLLYNLIAAEYGLRTRLGYREWCTNLDGEVRSVIPFTGSTAAQNRLFATTTTGIWDVTDTSTAPAQVLTFPTAELDNGWGASCVFVNSGGNHFCLYTDEAQGYHVYVESTGTWSAIAYGVGAGQINGTKPDGVTPIDPLRLCHVTVWANRVWFVERDTGYAWYGGVGALYGTLTPFSFGGRFRAGGDLRGLFNWTIDGGSGSVNSLVAISGGGDVAIYQGTDPSSAASFGLRGTWFVGGVPKGRRIATDFGGDLLILSSVGVVPVSRLTQGNPIFDRSQYATQKIGNLFNQLAYSGRDLDGWHVRLHPQDNALVVNVPQLSGTTIQLVMSLATKGWSQYRDLPNITASESYAGTLYFGTQDGRVCVSQDYLDGVLLADPDSYTPIQYSLLSAFQNLGSARKKRVQSIRPTILSTGGAPSYVVAARYGYDFTEVAEIVAASTVPDGTETDFLMSRAISYGDQVFVDGRLQVNGVDYTTSGTTLSFDATAVPALGSTISVYVVGDDGARTYVPLGSGTAGTWNFATWDSTTFAGEYSPTQNTTGAQGIGQDVAIAIRGVANSRTSIVGFDVMFDVGGFL